jgi:hypothetical protein
VLQCVSSGHTQGKMPIFSAAIDSLIRYVKDARSSKSWVLAWVGTCVISLPVKRGYSYIRTQ